MLLPFVLLAALGAACAGCSARSVNTVLAADNPASPDAASVPFVRPINVLAEGAAPQTGIPSTAMHMAGSSMPGMAHRSMAGMSTSPPGGEVAMRGMKMARATPPGAGEANAVGTVNAVDAARHAVKVTHRPIRALGWPSMTMAFPVASSIDLSTIKPGDQVAFTLGRTDADGNRQVVQLKPVPGSAGVRGSMPRMQMPGDPQ